MVLFRLIFKAYPFEESSVENSGVKDVSFIEDFINSEKRNVYNISEISEALKTLVCGMLWHENSQRWSIHDVLGSEWFKSMERLLTSSEETLEKTKQSIFSKLGYVVNVTRIKIPMPAEGWPQEP